MRIIDKNHDFYDYLQDPTDDLVFDRRNSFLLTKELFCRKIYTFYQRNSKYRLVLLQSGATFWLFLVVITKKGSMYEVLDYDMELLISWKNYDKPNALLKINLISGLIPYMWNRKIDDIEEIRSLAKEFRDKINRNDYRIDSILDTNITSKSHKDRYIEEKQTIPLLKACGIANLVDPAALFYAIEEYFSLEKMAKETTEPKGATNDDKIIMHGFDTKTSFRGKRR